MGQMLTFAAKQAGFKVVILDPTPACPAAQAADEQIVAPYDDRDAIERLATQADVLTYEFENVDLAALEAVSDRVSIPQGTELLRITKDRIREKTFLRDSGLRTAAFAPVNSADELRQAVATIGLPAILKTCEGGYDGKGQVTLRTVADLDSPVVREILATGQCILEQMVAFTCECSVMVGRSVSGEVTVFPVSENIHRNHILHESIVPARISPALRDEATQVAQKIAAKLNLCGILGVEMFMGKDGHVYVNELAPRPHNSGHYSIEACDFSQFAVHNRAICDWPMPEVHLLQPVVMVNVLGQHVEGVRRLIATKPQWHFHDYGKAEVRRDRKMGHVAVLTDDVAATLAEIDATGVWQEEQ